MEERHLEYAAWATLVRHRPVLWERDTVFSEELSYAIVEF
jgi:hypothetical protein